MLQLFVIVVTYKGKQWYDRCFQSLRQSILPIKTIVVDNASNDGTVDYIKDKYPEIILIESDKNLGFGQANNIGIRYALKNNCDYVFLLNQDAWIYPDTLQKLTQIAVSNVKYGVLSPVQLSPGGKSINPGFMGYITVDPSIVEDLYFGRLREVYETKLTNAATWLISREVLETVGGFDPIFFHYGEDDNYLQRLIYHNIPIGLCPSCMVCHALHGTTNYDNKVYISKCRFKSIAYIYLADINKTINLRNEYVYHIFKAVVSFILRRGGYKYHCQMAKVIRLEYNKIGKSRKVNIQKGTNWL